MVKQKRFDVTIYTHEAVEYESVPPKNMINAVLNNIESEVKAAYGGDWCKWVSEHISIKETKVLTKKSRSLFYKGFRVDWSPRRDAWKVLHKDGRGYLLMDFSSLKSAKEFIRTKVGLN